MQPENRHGLVVQDDATQANGVAERESALEMIDRQAPGTSNRLTLVADKAYDAREFVADLRQKCVTPHVVQKARISAIDGRTTRHAGYAVSQRKRKLVERAGHRAHIRKAHARRRCASRSRFSPKPGGDPV